MLSTDTCSTDAHRNRYIPNVPFLLIIMCGMNTVGFGVPAGRRGHYGVPLCCTM